MLTLGALPGTAEPRLRKAKVMASLAQFLKWSTESRAGCSRASDMTLSVNHEGAPRLLTFDGTKPRPNLGDDRLDHLVPEGVVDPFRLGILTRWSLHRNWATDQADPADDTLKSRKNYWNTRTVGLRNPNGNVPVAASNECAAFSVKEAGRPSRINAVRRNWRDRNAGSYRATLSISPEPRTSPHGRPIERVLGRFAGTYGRPVIRAI